MLSQKILKYIKYLAYLTVVLIPLIYFPTGIFPFQIIKVAFFQCLAEVIFALWLGLAIFHKEYRPKFTPILLALTIFMIIASLSSIFGIDWRMSLWSDESRTIGLIGLWHFFAFFLVLSSLREKINWKKLLFLSFGTAVLVSLIGVSQKFIVFPKTANIWFHILYSGIPDRIGSTLSNSAFMAGYLLFNFFIGLWLLIKQTNRLNGGQISDKGQAAKDSEFWFLIGGLVLILIAIFFSQTIGAILGLGIGIFALFLYFFFKKNESIITGINFRKLSLGLLILILIFSGIFWFSRSASFWQKIPGLSRIAQVSFENESIRGRLIAWRIALEAFKDKPLIGWGYENFRIAFNRHYDPNILTTTFSGSYWDKPHNVFLEYLSTTGILGLLAYLGIFIAAFYTLFKKNISSARSYLPAARPFILALLVSYIVQNLFLFDTIGTYLMFFLILAFIDFKNGNSAENKARPGENSNKILIQRNTVIFLLLLSLIPIHYNYQIFNASHYEYWGVNYFLNRLPESSLVSFSRAIETPTPYRDDIRKNFANTVKQAYQQNIQYPGLSELQGKLAEYLQLVIDRHPQEFFNYISLGEFKNVFYRYNSNYPKEAEELAQKALELSPDRQQTYYILAKAKILQGDIQAAYKLFEKTIALNPSVGGPHFDFGLVAYEIGDVKKGAEEIAKAEQLGRGPEKVDEFVALGSAVGDYEHNYKKAIEYYQSALQLQAQQNPDDKAYFSNILLKLALAYYFNGNKEQSRGAFSELKNLVDLRKLPIYSDLQPIFQELKIDY